MAKEVKVFDMREKGDDSYSYGITDRNKSKIADGKMIKIKIIKWTKGEKSIDIFLDTGYMVRIDGDVLEEIIKETVAEEV